MTVETTIQANELRLGNWVIGNGYYKIEFIDYQTDGYEPIPLTPEILEKCGFSDKGSGHLTKDIEQAFLLHDRDELSIYDHIENGSFDFPCKYLHQLQNLYFALTQTELNIQL